MKLKHVVIFFKIILSATLFFVVDLMGLNSFSGFGLEPESLISNISFMNYSNVYIFAFKLSIILLIVMIVMIRRAYDKRIIRLLHVSAPIFIALVIQFLLINQIDIHLRQHSYFGFLKAFFFGLPVFFTSYMIIGIILFLVIMVTCYPISILIDKLLLYITSKILRHNQG